MRGICLLFHFMKIVVRLGLALAGNARQHDVRRRRDRFLRVRNGGRLRLRRDLDPRRSDRVEKNGRRPSFRSRKSERNPHFRRAAPPVATGARTRNPRPLLRRPNRLPETAGPARRDVRFACVRRVARRRRARTFGRYRLLRQELGSRRTQHVLGAVPESRGRVERRRAISRIIGVLPNARADGRSRRPSRLRRSQRKRQTRASAGIPGLFVWFEYLVFAGFRQRKARSSRQFRRKCACFSFKIG